MGVGAWDVNSAWVVTVVAFSSVGARDEGIRGAVVVMGRGERGAVKLALGVV